MTWHDSVVPSRREIPLRNTVEIDEDDVDLYPQTLQDRRPDKNPEKANSYHSIKRIHVQTACCEELSETYTQIGYPIRFSDTVTRTIPTQSRFP